jgi:hypothetical protein
LFFFSFPPLSQDDDLKERHPKRYGTSSQSSSSPDSSICSLSPTYSIPSGDEKHSKPAINDATYTISSGQKLSEGNSKSIAAGNQRDSQSKVYSFSSKSNNSSRPSSNCTKKSTIDILSSPESEVTVETCEEASDFEAVTTLDVDDLSNYGVLSPLETQCDQKLLVNKNEKTPHSQKIRPGSLLSYKTKVEDKVPCYVTPSSEQRLCPLPILTWADREAVWTSMVRKDEKASLSRDGNMFDNHPSLQPRMRAILLDWLIEVCEVYKLHRETYYLTLDYIDRYLSGKNCISKNQLQLIGITCLFIASKVSSLLNVNFHLNIFNSLSH